MKKFILRSLAISCISIAPVVTMAGGVDVTPCCIQSNVDIPKMLNGWGFWVEASALRPYNVNLNYVGINPTIEETSGLNTIVWEAGINDSLTPTYDFNLRVGVSYALGDTANILKLFYEHLFHRDYSSSTQITVPHLTQLEYTDVLAQGTASQKLDGVTFLSEQHILLGSIWESTVSLGVRYARVSQHIQAWDLLNNYSSANLTPTNIESANDTFAMQFNGVGPLLGFGGIFNLWNNLVLGAETQAALLVGKNKIAANGSFIDVNKVSSTVYYDTVDDDIDSIYSMVPELYYRLYANYFYQFANATELQVELGWRANQFFNLRTFDTFNQLNGGFDRITVNTTTSDNIGFSGPYLMIQYVL
jgi:hypothetical protein